MITAISGFVFKKYFLVQKWPFRDAYLFFKKCLAETPIFIVFFGCALFGPSCQKREILDTRQKMTDNSKAIVLAWCFLVFSLICFLFSLVLLCFFVFSCLFCSLVFFVPFLSLILIEKTCLPQKRAFFVLSVSLCFSSAFFGSPFFNFSFSVSLSLSVYCSFLSFFLLVFLFSFFWFLVFVSFLFLSVFFAFVS